MDEVKKPGIIALMGSGELTATMVEVHKQLLRRCGPDARAVFLDTPAGFQLNVDHIARKAVQYFDERVGHPMHVASYKSSLDLDTPAAQQSFHVLRRADYMLLGPGSPTYALNQLQASPIPRLITQRVEAGGCLVTASAAALTVGRVTLPVYEIYKVGQAVHWVEGLDILGHFGLNLAVVPHWNNAEGGNHDTRYCFMGQPRLAQLEGLLPPETPILGLDEHTVLMIDLHRRSAAIQGMGTVTLRWRGRERVFKKNDAIPLDRLDSSAVDGAAAPAAGAPPQASQPAPSATPADAHWTVLHQLEDKVVESLQQGRAEQATHTLLELERHIWAVREQIEEEGGMGAAREVLRELVTRFGQHMAARPRSHESSVGPMVEAMLKLRRRYRKRKNWEAADLIRSSLETANVRIEDTPDGTRWHLQNPSSRHPERCIANSPGGAGEAAETGADANEPFARHERPHGGPSA
jgi:peptidase E